MNRRDTQHLSSGRTAIHGGPAVMGAWVAGIVLALLLGFLWSSTGAAGGQAGKGRAGMAFSLRSSSFTHEGAIPSRFTCEGDDVSPPLAWSGVPAGARSLALIMDDPDAPDPQAPKMTWVHWVLYNMPVTATGLPEAVVMQALPAGTLEGVNDWKRTGYGGPCPPIGRHRYFHKLYALDAELAGLASPTKAQLEAAMEGHILAKAEIMGTYQKKGK